MHSFALRHARLHIVIHLILDPGDPVFADLNMAGKPRLGRLQSAYVISTVGNAPRLQFSEAQQACHFVINSEARWRTMRHLLALTSNTEGRFE
jgi:hypothetical protein